MKFKRELYPKIALIKAAYNFSDVAYIHLDADECYYYVNIQPKDNRTVIDENDFINEMLTQSVRHEVYQQTKNIRELLLGRAMATSVIVDETLFEDTNTHDIFDENEILKDWFENNEESSI